MPPALECWTCGECNVIDLFDLNEHMSDFDHFGPNGPDCVCMCGRLCDDPLDLIIHRQRSHFYCTECDRFFRNSNNLRMVVLFCVAIASTLERD